MLLGLALILGATGAVVAQSYAAAGSAQLAAQLQRLGLSVITVKPMQSRNAGVRARTGAPVTTLVARDYEAIMRRVPGIERASATVNASFLAKAGELAKSNSTVVGVEPAFAQIRHWQLQSGEAFSDADQRSAARVAVLGATVARDLFNAADPVGQRLFINRVPFRVVGRLADSGSDLDAAGQDDQIFVPLRTASRRLLNVENYSSLALDVSDSASLPAVVEGLRRVLSATHRSESSGREDFQIQTQQALAAAAIDAESRVDRYVALIAAGSLLTAGFGTLAICWIAVGHRTPEIGTRRALGATAGGIFWQFLSEVSLTGLAAALGSVPFAWCMTVLVSRATTSPLQFHGFIVGAIAVAQLLLAMVCGTAPALRAAHVDPLVALRTK